MYQNEISDSTITLGLVKAKSKCSIVLTSLRNNPPISLSQGAAQKVKDYTQREGDKDAEEEANVLQRYSTISAAVMAEINHFHTERNKDFNTMMREFLASQIDFHQNVSLVLSTY
jgi:hypothetical protein